MGSYKTSSVIRNTEFLNSQLHLMDSATWTWLCREESNFSSHSFRCSDDI